MSYEYGIAPHMLRAIHLPEWQEFMHYQYLPVYMSNLAHEVRLPPRLEFLKPVVFEAMGDWDDHHPQADAWDPVYIYVTAKRGWASPESPLNRPGWHCDGFGSDDWNYIWSDVWPTRWANNHITHA